MKCCNCDENCPEWTVVKDWFFLVDDWNHYLALGIDVVDMFLNNATPIKNSNGISLPEEVYMTKEQYNELVKQWKDFKEKNKKLFKEE